jgi:hypothetical protein
MGLSMNRNKYGQCNGHKFSALSLSARFVGRSFFVNEYLRSIVEEARRNADCSLFYLYVILLKFESKNKF